MRRAAIQDESNPHFDHFALSKSIERLALCPPAIQAGGDRVIDAVVARRFEEDGVRRDAVGRERDLDERIAGRGGDAGERREVGAAGDEVVAAARDRRPGHPAQVNAPDFYRGDKDAIANTLSELEQCNLKLQKTYERWEYLDKLV